MSRYDFIFSNKICHRVARHMVFWIIYCIYFFVQSITPEKVEDFSQLQAYKNAFVSLISFVPVCAFSVYVSLYIILPYFLRKNKYLVVLLALLFLFVIDIFLNYFASAFFINHTLFESLYSNNNLWAIIRLGYLNALWAISISGFAMGIKLSGYWYRQKEENLKIVKSKTRAELSLRKAGIQPQFICGSLDSIYSKILSGSDISATMVIKLSDLLSYFLYESSKGLVPLQKELSIVQDFISLEQIKNNSCSNMVLQINGEPGEKYITPMVILLLVQNCATILNKDETKSCQANLNINIESSRLFMKLSFHFSINESTTIKEKLASLIQKIRNNALYKPGEYKIITDELAAASIILTLPLMNNNEPAINIVSLKTKGGIYESS